MRNLIVTIILITTMTLLTCKKKEVNIPSSKLAQLQHRWMFISRHGEVLRYIGTPDDYYDFSTDNILYRRVGQINDTSYYQLYSSNDSLLFVYPLINGIRSGTPINYNLIGLSDTSLVVNWRVSTSNPTLYVVDSLSR